jgi:hypothetical protein
MLQALYRHCAMHQRYWPADLVPASGSVGVADLADVADTVFPVEFDIPVGALLRYFWWGLSCRQSGFAALEGDAQLRYHLDAIKTAVLRADSLTRTRLKAALDAGLLIGSLLPLAPAIATGVNFAAAFKDADAVQTSFGAAFRSQEATLAAARGAAAGRTVSIGGVGAALDQAGNDAMALARVAEIVPFAIVIDNAEHLDLVTIGILRTLIRQGGAHGIVVVAVNTDVEFPQGPAGGNEVLAEWLDEESRRDRLTTLTLHDLTDHELADLAVHHLGRPVRPEVLATVTADSDGRPGRLVRLLSVPAVRKALIPTEKGTALPADLHRYTKSQLLEQAFLTLEEEDRDILCALSLFGPTTLCSFLEGTLENHQVDRAVATAWVRRYADRVEFASRDLWRTAYHQDQLLPEDEDAALNRLSAMIIEARSNNTWQAVDPALAESLLTVLLEGQGATVVRAELLAELTRLRRLTGRHEANRRLIEDIKTRLTDPVPSPHLVVAAAEVLYDAGRSQQAIDVLQTEYDRLVAKFGLHSGPTIPALHNLAAVWAETARRQLGQPAAGPLFAQAVELYELLLSLRARHHPKTDRRIPDTRYDLAKLEADRYHYPQAAEQTRRTLIEYQTLTSPKPPPIKIFVVRSDLAHYSGKAGDKAGARDQFAALLSDETRILGPDHPETLTTRNNLALWTGEAGDAVGARDQFAALLPDRMRILGPDHPDTLTTRENLAFWTGTAGDAAGARNQLHAMLPDRIRVLGPDHPDTVRTRNNAAYWTKEAGDTAAARDQLAAVLPDLERVLGPDHPITLTARNNAAHWTKKAGDTAAARDQLAALLPDRIRVLGPDHPDILRTREILAAWTGDAGDVAGARNQLAALLPDLERILGPDQPDTLRTRSNLAAWTGDAGDAAGARNQLAALLPDVERVLGPDHSLTLAIRNNLAAWAGDAGDAAGARNQLAALLPDLERILGPDHSLTLAVRNNLARWAIVDLFPVKARESVDKSGRAGVVD